MLLLQMHGECWSTSACGHHVRCLLDACSILSGWGLMVGIAAVCGAPVQADVATSCPSDLLSDSQSSSRATVFGLMLAWTQAMLGVVAVSRLVSRTIWATVNFWPKHPGVSRRLSQCPGCKSQPPGSSSWLDLFCSAVAACKDFFLPLITHTHSLCSGIGIDRHKL